MKSIRILKKLINIYYYFLLIAFIAGLIVIPILIFTNQPIKMTVFGHYINLVDLSLTKSIVIIVLFNVVLGFFIRSIWLLKTTAKELETGHYFSELVITNFKKVGKLFILCGFGFFAFNFLLNLFVESRLSVSTDSSLFIFLIIGLFFMFLSEIFKKANNLEQENDLTI